MTEVTSTLTPAAAAAKAPAVQKASAALTGTQKAAVVLMSMDQEAAAKVMKQFTDAEAEEIAGEIIKLRRVESGIADEVMTEYLDLTIKGGWSSRGGKDFATSLLEASFGAEHAGDLMTRVASNMAGKAFEFLDSVDSGQIVTLMDGELPQTIALVLAHMRPDHAAPVLASLDDDVRSEVAQSIGMMGIAIPEAVRLVADTLKLRAGAVVSSGESMEVVGGIQPLVEIINRADIATEKALLERLDEIDPELAEEVRSRMLTFADIVKLERRDVQQVLRGIDTAVLAVAMKGTTEAVGGIQPLVEIINRADISTEKALLERLDQIDPELAEEVRSRMLTFADIVKLEKRDVQQVLRGIDTAVLAVAMKGTTEAVTEVIKSNLSERNRELLDDETKSLGPVRTSQVEEARAEVVRAIRDLEAQGSITVQRGDEDEYVQ